MEIVVTRQDDPALCEQPVEMVERKGLGHPDTICDALAEEVSLALCEFYIQHFGGILHHNVDKVLLVGGQSQPSFGGGEVTVPIEIYLAGRATSEAHGVSVPVQELAMESCRHWLRTNLRHLDVERQVRLHCLIRPGSAELVDVFLRNQKAGQWLANDTSCGVGFAPFTPLETLVLRIERELRSESALHAHPERGEDIKVMAVRRGEEVALTVADAFVSRHVASLPDYIRHREALRQEVRMLGATADVEVNTGDDLPRGRIYLTVTGTSAEAGDDGEAGRGNRASGLITPYRPMTMESVAGKNPVSHVGKIYNVAAMQLAAALLRKLPELRTVTCYLVSRMGEPVSAPQLVHVRVRPAADCDLRAFDAAISSVVREQLSGLHNLYRDFLARRLLIA